MGWVAGARLVSATANSGALGILASATMDIDELRTAVAQVKQRTTRPFGVNLRADSADIDERIDLLIEQNIRVASFAQAPQQRLIKRLQAAGVLVIPSIGARRHAEKFWNGASMLCLYRVGKAAGIRVLSQLQFCCPMSLTLLPVAYQSLQQADFLMDKAS